MATAPSIDMIALSLRCCSLGRRRAPATSSSPALPPEEEGVGESEVAVELNSEVPLPYQWQQCLDIRTGQVYYVNWEDGSRTTADPRTAAQARPSSSSSTSNATFAAAGGVDSGSDCDTDALAGSGCDDDSSSCSSNNVSTSFSPTEGSASSDATSGSTGGERVLVLAGCRGCFMYFMVPKSTVVCPKCAHHHLLHLN